ncbi:antitermination regulator [Serinibacter arcticus]|uniref:Antitermination regulator n=1 Tax=Serinibacter arcticus TaxID=1655435 RepID=A0A2U1ZYN2_9MICO|nr:GAF and ANTAR domain-containing protein [Serinibacter arcticus]PWD52033.1 antitermination regulator [Serinibacter arcticus]
MDLPNDADDLAKRAVDLQNTVGLVDTVNRIISSAIEYVDDATHAGLTVQLHGSFISLASSSPTAAQADDLQYELGEGPTVDAFGCETWYRSGDLGQDERWPRWGPRAAALGLNSAVSLHFTLAGKPVAALTLYSSARDAFDNTAKLDLAALYASHAGIALNQARLLDSFEQALASRHIIGQAQGIVMERFGVDAEHAFAAIHRISVNSNTKVRIVAAQIVASRVIPTVKKQSSNPQS